MDPIKDALRRAGKMFPHARITPETVDIYAEELVDLPAEVVVQAVRETCRVEEQYFPTLGKIRNRAVAILGAGVLVDPESAWGEVMREVRRVGTRPLPVYVGGEIAEMPSRTFSSPFIAQAVDAIGWEELCQTQTEDMPTVRSQFRKALQAIQDRARDTVQSGRMAGLPQLSASSSTGWKSLPSAPTTPPTPPRKA